VTTQAQNNNAKELAAEGIRIIYWTIAFDNFRIPHIQEENVNIGSAGASVFYTNPAGSSRTSRRKAATRTA
jgi:hypothetical protein